MHRRFDTTETREQRHLDGTWEFTTALEADATPADFPAEPETIPVPCAWNALADYADHHGSAWYRRTITLPDCANVRVRFLAVSHEAIVYLDGERRVEHSGGYTPFEFVAEDLSAGEHELLVRAENGRSETTIPLPETDWFDYGGITREVVLETVPNVYIDDFDLRYDLASDPDGGRTTARIRADVDVSNCDRETDRTVAVTIGETTVRERVTVPAGKTSVELALERPVDRWTLDDPTLYDVTVALEAEETVVDDRRDRIGFREVTVDGREILLNGEPVDLRGVNRHEDHPEWGSAQPLRVMREDLARIREAGLNCIRCSHYPNHPRFLDLCDELGVLVIEELPYWHFDADDFERADLLERGERMLEEMISRDRHHPSVFAWSLTNECANEQAGVAEATDHLATVARETDDSRLVTLASYNEWVDRGEDRCLEHCDFACVNGYYGWYTDEPVAADQWTGFLERIADRRDCPIFVSEFGAGAIEGERTWERAKWSETYQSEFFETVLPVLLADDSVAGFTIWQFCDTRTSRDPMSRPKSKNNKGIVGEYRRPKAAYETVRRLLTE
ncbi:glycoside hydrolase family 2 protein [Halopiger aswanensis]|uniref:Beta-glucuronidase n=1 Tax=Halopiger aswanensis TaxID=148449 RepID=A0A3R7GTS2_9EURY|nr:glycoside hydrolase family 2 TIM barrel-domain containing protein [Halopiger aswanensis]RKD89245.1 beta-glucuronidase [Halopiger aswanensis]